MYLVLRVCTPQVLRVCMLKVPTATRCFSNYGKLENKQLNLILKYEPEINLFFLLNLHLVSES